MTGRDLVQTKKPGFRPAFPWLNGPVDVLFRSCLPSVKDLLAWTKCLDLPDHWIGQRDVIQFLGLSSALFSARSRKLGNEVILVRRAVFAQEFLAQEHIRRRRDRPALVTGLVRQDQTERLLLGPRNAQTAGKSAITIDFRVPSGSHLSAGDRLSQAVTGVVTRMKHNCHKKFGSSLA